MAEITPSKNEIEAVFKRLRGIATNKNTFFQQHNCTSTDAQQKYNSRAAQLYREKLSAMSQQAMRIHGTRLQIDGHTVESPAHDKKEVDFFEEHTNGVVPSIPDYDMNTVTVQDLVANGVVNNGNDDPIEGPNVDSALNVNPMEVHVGGQPRKSTIGQRKPASKLGAKKVGGMGAQRVKTDFSALEKEAARNDAMKHEANIVTVTKASAEEQQKSLVSLNQAYEDMSVASKREEERMKRVDPKKAEQAERLGMGFGSKGSVAHSMFGEMKTIEQETPLSVRGSGGSRGSKSFRDEEPIEEDFETIIRFSPGPSKFKDSTSDEFGFAGFGSKGSSGIDDLLSKPAATTSSSAWDNEFDGKTGAGSGSSGLGTKGANYKYTPIEEKKAQQMFGNAKAISSDMFSHDRDHSSEMRSNLSRFEGSSSISSAQLFGTPEPKPYRGASMQTPDLDDVKESVRQGVTKVAGRLSNMANNVMSSIQDRYM